MLMKTQTLARGNKGKKPLVIQDNKEKKLHEEWKR
jgi:hypothetical protein